MTMSQRKESASKSFKKYVKSFHPEIYRKWRWNNTSDKDDVNIDLQRLQFQECPNCYSDLKVNNCQVRIKPKMKLTQSLKKLLKKATLNKRKLSKKQMHLVDLYTNSKNNIVVRCLTCNKIVQLPGVSRQEVVKQRSEYIHTATSHDDNRTSNIGSRSKPASSKSAQVKTVSKKKKQKMKGQSLQFILSQEKRRESGGSLKDFLSSIK